MISSLDVHHSGDHLVVGSLDRRMIWFDLDLGEMPYKTLKYHEKAIRGVRFHQRYPLMGSCSDDGNVHIFHSMVYSDLMRNPLVIPVKVLRDAHKITKKIGVLDMRRGLKAKTIKPLPFTKTHEFFIAHPTLQFTPPSSASAPPKAVEA